MNPTIDDNLCRGCGVCATGCPQEAIRMHKIRESVLERYYTQRIQGESREGATVVSEPVIDKVRSRVSVARSFSAVLKGVSAPVKLTAVNPNENNT